MSVGSGTMDGCETGVRSCVRQMKVYYFTENYVSALKVISEFEMLMRNCDLHASLE